MPSLSTDEYLGDTHVTATQTSKQEFASTRTNTGDCDTINFISNQISELAVEGTLSQIIDERPVSIQVKVVADSGANRTYIILGKSSRRFPLVTSAIPEQAQAELADKSIISINRQCDVTLTIPPASPNQIIMRVLDVPVECEGIVVLLGLEAMSQLRITLVHGKSFLINDVFIPLMKPSFSSTSEKDSIRQLVDLIPPDVTEPILPTMSPADEELVSAVIRSLVDREWYPVKKCPGIKCRLRQLMPCELTDSVSQSFAFELSLPPPLPTCGVERFYAKSAYNKLSNDLKKSYEDLVLEYVRMDWWQAEPEDSRLLSEYPGGNVFISGVMHMSPPSQILRVPSGLVLRRYVQYSI